MFHGEPPSNIPLTGDTKFTFCVVRLSGHAAHNNVQERQPWEATSCRRFSTWPQPDRCHAIVPITCSGTNSGLHSSVPCRSIAPFQTSSTRNSGSLNDHSKHQPLARQASTTEPRMSVSGTMAFICSKLQPRKERWLLNPRQCR
jgi:hypothetical protein